ncbi:hypothetical protein [Flavobacterium sp.]|uniref:hypothetical protein n=1 Tax=Flavobacterium sp. TaxID=239 RepID=UPI003D0F6D2A
MKIVSQGVHNTTKQKISDLTSEIASFIERTYNAFNYQPKKIPNSNHKIGIWDLYFIVI